MHRVLWKLSRSKLNVYVKCSAPTGSDCYWIKAKPIDEDDELYAFQTGKDEFYFVPKGRLEVILATKEAFTEVKEGKEGNNNMFR